jgi:hypothetical protein
MARHGLSWWQIDTNWYQIKFLELIGLAKDIKLPRADSRVRDLHAHPETADSEPELTAAYGD